MLRVARCYIKVLNMNVLYMTLSSLSQKHAYGLQNLTVVAGMQRERDKV